MKLIDLGQEKKYARTYTTNDIGEQIHIKEDLVDIYETILSEEHLDLINSGERRSNVDYLSFSYQLGNPIMRKNRSFAVLSGGII